MDTGVLPGGGAFSMTALVFDAVNGLSVVGFDMDMSGTLPVKLVSFTGVANGSANELVWATASEQNAAYFGIERSLDGTSYQEIGRVKAENRSVGATYRYTDARPAGRAYYRLRMTDADGSAELSSVVTVTRRGSGFTAASVSPNPTAGVVRVEYTVSESAAMTFMLYDVLGNLHSTVRVTAESGYNLQSIDLSDYPKGIYTVVLDRDNKERVVRKVVKL